MSAIKTCIPSFLSTWFKLIPTSTRLFTVYQVRHLPRGSFGNRHTSVDNLPDPENIKPRFHKDPQLSGDDLEDDLDWFTDQMKDQDFVKTITEDHEKHKKFVTYKTIQRKYFKPAPEPNLLTWDAKEQIRFLNREFPEDWTVDKLAESFPCTREGITRILKSNYQPKNLNELKRHDQRVRTRWLALQKGREAQGPIALRYEQLESEGKVELMLNAAGIKMFPKPKISLTDSLHRNAKNDVPRLPGPFESIVKDYAEKKKHCDGQLKKPVNREVSDQELLASIFHSEKEGHSKKLKNEGKISTSTYIESGMVKDINKLHGTNQARQRYKSTGRSTFSSTNPSRKSMSSMADFKDNLGESFPSGSHHENRDDGHHGSTSDFYAEHFADSDHMQRDHCLTRTDRRKRSRRQLRTVRTSFKED